MSDRTHLNKDDLTYALDYAWKACEIQYHVDVDKLLAKLNEFLEEVPNE